VIAITALIAPFAAARARARELIEPVAPFLLVWIRVPLAVAEGRDVKGLYAKARRGEIQEFTGISSPYEDPGDADVIVDTDALTVDAAVELVLARLEAVLA
jgi:sulfate adenylyltransferase